MSKQLLNVGFIDNGDQGADKRVRETSLNAGVSSNDITLKGGPAFADMHALRQKQGHP